jgi:hypothetical protein
MPWDTDALETRQHGDTAAGPFHDLVDHLLRIEQAENLEPVAYR